MVTRRLVEWLPEAQKCGRIIIVPEINSLAVQAWTRNTPIDGKNLNRVFPGRLDGSVSERIADAISRVLMPMWTPYLICTVSDRHGFSTVGHHTSLR
ncbi:succinylglutamate desuccinylase/aspartoacylase family protein [Mesorhizobium sp. M1300]